MAAEPLEFNAIVSNDSINLHLVQGWRVRCVENSEHFGACSVTESKSAKTVTLRDMELLSDEEQLPLFLTVMFTDFPKLSRFEMKDGARFVEVHHSDPAVRASFVYVKTIRGTTAPSGNSNDTAPYLHEHVFESSGGQRMTSLRLKLLSFKSNQSNGDISAKRSCFIDRMSFVINTGEVIAQPDNPMKSVLQASSSSGSMHSSPMGPQMLAGFLKSSLQPRPPASPAVPQASSPSLSALQPMLMAMSAMFDEKLKPLQQQLDRLESKVEQLIAIHQKLLSDNNEQHPKSES